MQQGGTIVWVIDADSSAFLAQLQKASTQAKNFGDSLNQSIASKVASATKSAANNLTSLADSMSGLTRAGLALAASGGISIGAFVKTASQLETTSKQVQVLTGSVTDAQKVFGELYNYTLGKPITFPDASKAAKTLLGYGRTVNQVIPDMKTLSTLSIVNGADLQSLALVFGQITSRGALFGQDALQLINNNIPLTTILAKKFGVTMEQASAMINGGQVSAEQFTAAMADYSKSLDISSMSDTFQNRMISLQGTIRSLGLSLLGIKIDPVKGFVVEAGGLFDTLSQALEQFVAFLKTPEMKQGIADLGKHLAESAKNAEPFIENVLLWIVNNFDTVITLVKIFTGTLIALRVAAFSLNAISTVASTFDLLAKGFSAASLAAKGFQIVMSGGMIAEAGGAAGVFLKIGGALASVASTIGSVLMPVLGALRVGLSFLFVSTPIGWIVLAITAIVTAFVWLWNNVEPFRNFWIGVWNDILGAAQKVGEWFAGPFTQFFAGVWKGIEDGAQGLVNFFSGVGTVIRLLFDFITGGDPTLKSSEGAFAGFAKTLSGVRDTIMAVADAIGGFFGKIGDAIGSAVSFIGGVMAGIGAAIASGFNVVVSVVSTVINILTPLWQIIGLVGYAIGGLAQIVFTVFSTIGQVIFTIVSTIVQIIGVVLYGTFLKLVQLFEWIGSYMPAIWNGIVTAVTNAVNTIVGVITTVFGGAVIIMQTILGAIGTFFVNTWNGIVAFLTPIVTVIVGIITTAFDTISTFITTVFTAISTTITTVWNAIVAFLTPAINAIAAVFTTVFNAVAATVNTIFGLISQYIINPIANVVNYVGRTIGQIATFIGNAVRDAYNAVAGFVNQFTTAGRNIIDGIVNGIKAGSGQVVNFIKNICANALNAVKSFFGIHSPSTVMASMGEFLMQGFGKGINSESDTVVKAAQSAADGVMGVFDNLQATAGTMQSDFGVTSSLAVSAAQIAPVSVDPQQVQAQTNKNGVTINQTNEVYTDLDMDQVNRNLSWELNKI